MINSNVTTISLSGGETAVEFEKSYPYYFIRNDGDAPIYASLSPNITPETQGVYTIPAGGTERIGAGYALPKFYISGTGKVQIRGEQTAVLPSFKRAAKGGETNALTTDKLVFSLDTNFATYNTNVSLGLPSTYNLPLGTVPKTAEIVSKCGTESNFLFSYGKGDRGQTFAVTQTEFVGYYNGVAYADLDNIHGKTRHIVCTTENKSIAIYVNGVKVVDDELTYPCDPNDIGFSLNSFRSDNPVNTSDSVLYVLRFYSKILSEAEVLNNYKIFSKKYKIEI